MEQKRRGGANSLGIDAWCQKEPNAIIIHLNIDVPLTFVPGVRFLVESCRITHKMSSYHAICLVNEKHANSEPRLHDGPGSST